MKGPKLTILSLIRQRMPKISSPEDNPATWQNNDFGVSSYLRKTQIVKKYYDEHRKAHEEDIEALEELFKSRAEKNVHRAFREWIPVLYDTIAQEDGMYIFICAHENHYSFEFSEFHKTDRLLNWFMYNPICVGDGYAFPLGYYRIEPYSLGSEKWERLNITCEDDIKKICATSLQKRVAIIAVPSSGKIEYCYIGGDGRGVYNFMEYLIANGSNLWMCSIPDPVSMGELMWKAD